MKTLKEYKHIVAKKEFNTILQKFIPFCKKELGIKDTPNINFVGPEVAKDKGTFGVYKKGEIFVDLHQRHPADILRTIAHELTHYSQHQNKEKDPHRGEAGSMSENNANILASIIMRKFDKKYPEIFKLSHIN